MRKLIVIEEDGFVRDFITSGAFDAINDEEAFYVSGPLKDSADLEAMGNYLGAVSQPEERKAPYHWLRKVLLTSHRFRSRAQRLKLQTKPFLERQRLKFWAAPGVRHLLIRRTLRRLGLHPELHPLIEKVRPDIVVFPTGGTDTITFDAARSARLLGIPTLSVIYSWDNLSIKGVFPQESDFYAVPGEQSREIAEKLHRISPERVFPVGSPYIDHHFHHRPGSTQRLFHFPYALFIGGSLKFDELTALEMLEVEIERHSLPITVVYRPHPNREPRDVSDFVDENRFRHVVIDPQVYEGYLATFGKASEPKPTMPPLDYYPALLEHAEFVISPLTTMMLEAAIFERRVAVIAYNDGVHTESADWIWNWEFADGMEWIDGFAMCKQMEDLPRVFSGMVTGDICTTRSIRDQIGHIIYYDQRTYGERLAQLVEQLVTRSNTKGPKYLS